MIVGNGLDLCDIRRIEKVIERFGKRFLFRIFTIFEIQQAEKRAGKNRLGTYAKRWAAKEACAKALGTGFSKGVFYKDIEVINLPSGKPTLKLAHGAANQLAYLIGSGLMNISLTMTDEYPYAVAHVIIETLKD
ncbi:Holo-[acyl-carrier-protein] synthase [Commensalibacter sp. Nvir]|uniref:holo-ACP synthase n=1 Tax=Commensalibacter sp. Nvir TaxID=3069817 RepID=UPI002D36BFF6|nr:Holo-[acyl-carrier-protein] synthase [Commensalibacter sp. Nvir]